MNEIQRLIHEMCPDGVPMVALNSLCNVLRGKRLTKDKLSPNGKYPVFHGGLEPLGYYDSSNRPANSVMVINVGASAGTVGFCNHEFWSSDGCFSISHNPLLHSKFLYYYLFGQTKNIQRKVRVAGIPTLDNAVVEKIQIPLPPLPIQQRIVEILDKFTSLVSSLDSEIALRQKQFEYYRNKLLSFEEGEEGVEWKKLIDIVSEDCSVSYGIVQPGDDIPNGIPVVRPVDMTDNIVFNKGLKRTQKENSDAYSRTILKGGEILVCVRGTTGIVSIASQGLKGCNVTRGIVPLSFKNDIETKFVFHTFKTHFIQDAIENKTNGTGLRQINIKDLKEILFPIPPLPKQLSIVRTLDTFESLLTNLKKERELRQKQYEYYREKLLTFA